MDLKKQKTIKNNSSLSGVGLHTGQDVVITFKPAKENTGIVFVRTDLEGSPVIEAKCKYVQATNRGTVLKKGNITISTTEHVLSAIMAMDIDNIIVELTASEPPIMDGSAKFFIESLEKSEVVDQDADRDFFKLDKVISFKDEKTGSEIMAIPSDDFEVSVMIDFGTNVLGTQSCTLSDMNDFKSEISEARTFSFLHELEYLLNEGLIKGGDLNNAIIYVDKEITPQTEEKLKKAFNKDKISIRPNGILDNLSLRYSNEAARHKLLDVVGDLALVGTRIKAKIIANKPGHFVNTEFAKKLSNYINSKVNVPTYDPKKKPLMDVNDIMKKLPHRYPFLLVDKVIEIEKDKIVGVKNVTMNEPFFIGHFPTSPVMPGVLQVEALAQLGGILTLNMVDDPENYLTYFMTMNKVKFRKKVLPGDTIIMTMELMSPMRRGICNMMGRGFVGDELVVEGELTAIISKNK